MNKLPIEQIDAGLTASSDRDRIDSHICAWGDG